MAVASLFKAVLGQNWYPARPSAVSSSQKLGATGVGVAASVGVGVAVNVGPGLGVGTVASVEVGVTESVAPVGVATCVVGGAEDVADTDATAVELAMKVVTDTTTMLLVGAGERPRSKSVTKLPLEHVTNIPSVTFRAAPVSAEYSSDTPASPQSNLFPESWLQF